MIQIVSHTTLPSESVARLLEALALPQPKVLHYGCGVNKLKQYEYFKEHNIPHPEWTLNSDVARSWVEAGHVVFARKRIKGQTGAGIIIVENMTQFPDEEIKVFTKYIKKKREFRVNCFQQKVLNMREKVRTAGATGPTYIRNVANGYTTTHCRPMSPELKVKLEDLAMKACGVSKSDFIGVDIGYNEFKDLAFVLEVNSGPSIEGSSIQDFVKAIQNVQD